jgi:hypothetical protein
MHSLAKVSSDAGGLVEEVDAVYGRRGSSRELMLKGIVSEQPCESAEQHLEKSPEPTERR